MFNTLLMGLNLTFTYAVYAPALFPGVNIVLASTIAAPLCFIIGLCWLFFTLCMPRAGGDFVWVSRSLHPVLGLVCSLPLVGAFFSLSGSLGRAFQDVGIAGMLASVGIITKNPGLINAIPVWTSREVSFAIMLISLVISLLVIIAGTKATFRFGWACYIVVCIGIIAYVVSMLSIGHAGFVARFNEVSGANYDEIIKAAQSTGYTTSFTSTATVVGTVFAFLNYYGFAWSAYYAGEMKEFGRSNIIAILGSVILFWAVTTFQYWLTYEVVGSEFFHAASYLAMTGNPAWNQPMGPFLTYLVAFSTTNPWLAGLVGFSLWVEVVATLVTYWVMTTRVFFAWSFDRLLPSAFSEIDTRFHAPRNAVILTGVISAICIFLGYYTTILGFLLYGTMGVFGSCAFVGIAAMVFPYRRKDIFQKAPKLVQTKIAGVPVMSILGVLTAVIGAAVAVFTAMPAYTGGPVNPSYVSIVLGMFLIAPVYYAIAYWYNRRRGLDMSIAYRELPPL
jgi:amino acid transporter